MKNKEFTPERYEPEDYKASPIAYEHWHRYMSVSSLTKDKIVLDIACGNGYGSNFLSLSATKVTGVDIDKAVIASSKKKYVNDNIEFLVGSIAQIPMADQSVDVVVSFETIEHVAEVDQHKFMREVNRVLKPEGILIVSTPNLDSPQYTDVDNEYHIKEFEYQEYITFCRKYFKYVTEYGQSILTGSVISRNTQNSNNTPKVDDLELHKVVFDEHGAAEGAGYKADGKFIVTICSNKTDSYFPPSVLWDVEDTFLKEYDHYVQSLQQELTKQLKYLDTIEVNAKETEQGYVKALADATESKNSTEEYAVSLEQKLNEVNQVVVEEQTAWKVERKQFDLALKEANKVVEAKREAWDNEKTEYDKACQDATKSKGLAKEYAASLDQKLDEIDQVVETEREAWTNEQAQYVHALEQAEKSKVSAVEYATSLAEKLSDVNQVVETEREAWESEQAQYVHALEQTEKSKVSAVEYAGSLEQKIDEIDQVVETEREAWKSEQTQYAKVLEQTEKSKVSAVEYAISLEQELNEINVAVEVERLAWSNEKTEYDKARENATKSKGQAEEYANSLEEKLGEVTGIIEVERLAWESEQHSYSHVLADITKAKDLVDQYAVSLEQELVEVNEVINTERSVWSRENAEYRKALKDITTSRGLAEKRSTSLAEEMTSLKIDVEAEREQWKIDFKELNESLVQLGNEHSELRESIKSHWAHFIFKEQLK